ncbi:MAG: hypothetical protein M3275_14285 [Thermoproteota archaeon]|nr:hypothetical protein [Thermoproteota archaeon]
MTIFCAEDNTKQCIYSSIRGRGERRREREFPRLYDDLHKLLVKSDATLVKSEEHLSTTSSVNDKQTLSRQELDQQQRESRNRAQNRYWTWK